MIKHPPPSTNNLRFEFYKINFASSARTHRRIEMAQEQKYIYALGKYKIFTHLFGVSISWNWYANSMSYSMRIHLFLCLSTSHSFFCLSSPGTHFTLNIVMCCCCCCDFFLSLILVLAWHFAWRCVEMFAWYACVAHFVIPTDEHMGDELKRKSRILIEIILT